MEVLIRHIFLLCLLLKAFTPVDAQKEDIQFEHLSMRDGLSMNPVMAIVQDHKGFLWFGTQDGLNRYDGYSFKVFKNRDTDSSSLSDNFITSLCMGPGGIVWVGTHTGGLNSFDYRKKGFGRYHTGNSSLSSDRVWCISADHKNLLWVGTDKGLCIIRENRIFPGEVLIPVLKDLNESTVLSIYTDRKNNTWIGTTEGLYMYSLYLKKLAYFDKNHLSNPVILSVFESAGNVIWVGTLDGLNKMQPDGTFKKYFFKERITFVQNDSTSRSSAIKNIYSIVNNYGGNTIRNIMEDHTGNLWIGTDMELVIFNPATEEFVNYKKDLINPTGINDHFIRSIYKDKADILWIGTMGNGINRTDLKPKKFKHYQKKLNDPTSLPENYVRCIAENGKGEMYVGTLIGGLALFESGTEKFLPLKSDGKNNGLTPSDNNIWSLLFENDSLLWIGTNNGLNRYDISSGKFTYYRHSDKQSGSISENTIRSIFIDSQGTLWVGTEGGLNKFFRETQTFESYAKGKDNPKAISDNTIWKIVEDSEHKLWLATNNGLNRFDPRAYRFTHYKNNLSDTFSLSHNGVRTLLIDRKKRLWVGTQNGLNLYLPEKNGFRRFDESDGLPNAFIYSIEEDSEGQLWISTNKGLSCMNTESFTFKSYDIYDGLQDFEFNTNASCKTLSGELYFGGPGGMNRFHPVNIRSSLVNANIELTLIKVFDTVYNPGTDVSELKELILDYNENSLYFEFASLDFSNSSRNRYSYKMEGFDKDWIDAGHRRNATYTNLDPGEYVFKIKGTNSDGVWSKEEKELKITIRHPYWQTTWFYIFCFALVVIVVYLVYRWRVKKLTAEKKLLEQKVAERTSDLEEEKRKIEAFNHDLEKLSIVASGTDNAVIITDENGVIEWINESFARMHCLYDDHTLYYGKTIVETSSNEKISQIIESAIGEKKSKTYESVNVNIDGKKFYVQSTLTPIFNENGKLKKLVIIDTDISERKKAEEIIRIKNKDITDSINYALRIQEAMLPETGQMRNILEDSFVYFRPKDIVSGDFYFCEKIKTNDGVVLSGFAVGDCTGHGVPGAFMSIIANNYLMQSLTDKNVNSPADALGYISNKIYATLSKRNRLGVIRDGMDMAFCVYHPAAGKIFFSGANRPVVVISEGKLKEIRGNAQPVGYHDNPVPFTNHAIEVKKGDMVYLFSDGFADQFGGPEGKKFKYSRFKELLASVFSLPVEKQKEKLARVFELWKGDLEQLDDICVMGVRI